MSACGVDLHTASAKRVRVLATFILKDRNLSTQPVQKEDPAPRLAWFLHQNHIGDHSEASRCEAIEA